MTPPKRRWIGLVAFVAACFAVAWLGSAVTMPKIDGWYIALA